MDNSIITLYLAPFGYAAASSEEWMSSRANDNRSHLNLGIKGHRENGGHTFYAVECRLVSEAMSLDLEWQASHRLKHLREHLHGTVKHELGKSYEHIFVSAPFAKKGGFNGTSERLQKWFITLATTVNDGKASPALVAQLLLFLQAPAQSGHHNAAQTVDADYSLQLSTNSASPPLESRSLQWFSGQTEDTSSPGGSVWNAAEPVVDESLDASGELGSVCAKHLGAKMYLQSYGYEPSTATEWSVLPNASLRKPRLQLGVDGHAEKDGHTLYSVHCKLVTQEPMINQEWPVERSLTLLREDFHDVVKEGFGERYLNLFASTPFACRGGISGTTDRLKAWLATVAECVNDGIAKPVLVAHILTVLDAPPLGPLLVPDVHPTGKATQSGVDECMSVSEATPKLRSIPLVFDMSSDDGEFEATDDEIASVWTWSPEKRRAGFTKLRDWFVDLKRRFERGLKS